TAAGTPGVGVRGMQERIRQLDGTLDISSGGHGTRVIVRLPIPETHTSDRILTEDSASHAA
ncbi:MAG TPA: hypothetical protein VMP68_03830, partial [Candidatus Eisenbacteria bacterium]|nr:hypothetical protein [Candidatus Eisenbacteria bacterium]